MSDRLHDALDDELPLDELSAEERARLAGFEARVDEVRAALDARAPDVAAAVMRRIHELGVEPAGPAPARGPLAVAWSAIWSVREIRVRWRPVYGLAAAGLAAVLLLLPSGRGPAVDTADTGVAGAGGEPAIYVQFRLLADDAESVALAGSFTEWRPSHQLREAAPGIWTVLLPLPPGVHDYAFVVDGERWVPDPLAPQVDDGFGGANSRLALLEPATGR